MTKWLAFSSTSHNEYVLIVDDEQALCEAICSSLGLDSLESSSVNNLGAAREIISCKTPMAIVTDLHLKGERGTDLMRWCNDKGMDIPFVIITGYGNMDDAIEALHLGAEAFLQKPFSLAELKRTLDKILVRRRQEAVFRNVEEHLRQENRSLRQDFVDGLVEQRKLFLGSLEALAETIDARDSYTRRHSKSVALCACAMASHLKLSGESRQQIEIAGALHDIGKIAVPESILGKPGPLTEAEFAVMKEHPARAAAILAPLPGLEEALPAIRAHHEKYSGGGYPDGIKGEEIPRMARILSVCDVWDAITTDRPYRKALAAEGALAIIKKESGRQLDPEFVDALVSLVESGDILPGNMLCN